MSNIKLIDGITVNLDLLKGIEIMPEYARIKGKQDNYFLGFYYNLNSYSMEFARGKILYKTKEEAENRIREILKKQNSDDIKI